MLRVERTLTRALVIALIGATACASVSLADRASTVTPSPGMIREYPLTESLAGSYQIGLDTLSIGLEDNVWFPVATTEPPVIERMTPTGLINGEFAIPDPSGQGWINVRNELDGLARGSAGNMWFTDITDKGKEFVGRTTPTGKMSEFALPPGSGPAGIALGSDGAMWFVERGTGTVGRVNEAGVISQYSIPGTVHGTGLGEKNNVPMDITLGGDGDMWFTDSGTNEARSFIGRIAPSGTISEFTISVENSGPSGIALGSDGNMWFAEPGVSRIGRITPTGTITEFAAPSVGGDIVAGSDGNIWFTESSEVNAVGRITPEGQVTSFAPISTDGENPVEIAAGSNGDIWITDASFTHLRRLIVPLAPTNTGLPTISGEAVEGQLLSVSEGSWTNDPSAIGYQWQVCDASGEGCVDLGGELAATHVVTAGDVGHRLRALVSTGNLGGSATAVSAVSAIVGAPPPALMVPRSLAITEAPPAVGVSMTWNFGWSRTYTFVESLVVHDLPANGSIEVACHGRGCPLSRWRSATMASHRPCHGRNCSAKPQPAPPRGSANLTGLFKGRHLRVGARISVSVTKAGWSGKSFLFTVRTNRSPRVQIECLAPGSKTSGRTC
jgi:streptogramin lyase